MPRYRNRNGEGNGNAARTGRLAAQQPRGCCCCCRFLFFLCVRRSLAGSWRSSADGRRGTAGRLARAARCRERFSPRRGGCSQREHGWPAGPMRHGTVCSVTGLHAPHTFWPGQFLSRSALSAELSSVQPPLRCIAMCRAECAWANDGATSRASLLRPALHSHGNLTRVQCTVLHCTALYGTGADHCCRQRDAFRCLPPHSLTHGATRARMT